MVAFVKLPESNRHVSKLKQLVEQSERHISCAIFADDDPVLLRQLREAFSKESGAIIPAPQVLWGAGEYALQEAAVWSVEEAAVNCLVLVGNSAAVDAASEPTLTKQTRVDETEQGPLASARTAATKRRLAEEHFSQHVQALLNAPEISVPLARGKLTLYFLFYRAESGLFSAYDPASGSFRALLTESQAI
jgi:hypothetical protein